MAGKRGTPSKRRAQNDETIGQVETQNLQAFSMESPSKRVRKSPTVKHEPKAPATPARNVAELESPPLPEGCSRCAWSTIYTGASEARYVQYHDEEWGVPCVDDKRLMEYIVLDGAQCGLSWSTILSKRSGYAEAFKQWDIEKIAEMSDADVEKLLKPDSGIVRHKGKIQSAIHNARLVLDIQKEHGSLAAYLWSMMPDKRPIVNTYKAMKDVPAKTELATDISKQLKKLGFKFVGPTMVYAFMQAAGFVNDHTVDCFRYAAINKMHKDFKVPASY